ncbi:myotubularin related protein 3 [Rhinolophus ferrumequinum]|uniref:Myotubularin related protein 3 n=1 Tax=Rhinolophus ferrumequinum TaxID=59479 RepID=A0A7J7RPU9_RHIFE|nr:myotubularin related protein 3 [Rhinolophus ferrumequinum]
MENILQEATKEEVGVEEPAHRGSIEMQEGKEEVLLGKESRAKAPEGSGTELQPAPALDAAALRSPPGTSLSLFSQGIPEQQGGHSVLPSSLQEPLGGDEAQEVPVEQPQVGAVAEDREEANLPIPADANIGYGASQSSSLLPSQGSFEARGPNIDSPMDMLMEDKMKSEGGSQGHHRPYLLNSDKFSGKDMLPEAMEPRPSERSLAERPQVGPVVHRTSPGSARGPVHSSCALPVAESKEGLVCNGAPETENKAPEQPPGLSTLQKSPTPNGHCANGEVGRSKDSLSRQLSAISCTSAHLHLRNLHHKWLHSQSGRPSATGSPDQPSRSHLDDDGMAVYTDTIQQRLRQIESGHQQEVETLKKQVQELRSRLESQYLTSSLRFNGDFGDEVTSIPDSESNLDQNCLSRCSTEIFSEASWEQVDKQDTEVQAQPLF